MFYMTIKEPDMSYSTFFGTKKIPLSPGNSCFWGKKRKITRLAWSDPELPTELPEVKTKKWAK